MDMKWNIDLDSIKKPEFRKKQKAYNLAKSQMKARTYHHELYGLLAKNKSIHEFSAKKGKTKFFSEGSTQYILRKTLSDTVQRVPDGELETPYDKASVEHILLQYLFEHKVMWQSQNGVDMLSNLTNTYKMAFIYSFAPVRTGFVRGESGEVEVSYNLESWADVFTSPDCKDIRKTEVVWFRQYMSKDEIFALIDWETGEVSDPTYNADTIKYVLDHKMFGSKQYESEMLADKMKSSTSLNSLELITEYRRGDDEFVTFVPGLDAEFRRVKNYDPQKEIPWNFFVLETDPDFPLGVSQVEFLLADQQFNDLFQTSAYKNLLLAMEPPIMVSGWETTPSSFRYEPRRIWNIGNNPNNKVEPVKIDNSILSGWSTTREAIAASMSRNLLVMDGTLAKDSGTTYSKTAPGVQAQQDAKTININQYQKRMEYFVGQWAKQALAMYVNSMGGVHEMAVDEKTRRKLADIGREDLIDGDKVSIDFSLLSAESLSFEVRSGSLVQRKEDQERQALAELVQPFIQNLNGWSEENRAVIENDVLLPIARRMLELSDVDIAQTLAESLATQQAKLMLQDMQQEIQGLQQQNDMQAQQIGQLEAQAQPMPEEEMGEAGPVSPDSVPLPASQQAPEQAAYMPPEQASQQETPAQQVMSYDDMMML